MRFGWHQEKDDLSYLGTCQKSWALFKRDHGDSDHHCFSKDHMGKLIEIRTCRKCGDMGWRLLTKERFENAKTEILEREKDA